VQTPFNDLVTMEQEVHVLVTLILAKGIENKLYYILYFYSTAFIYNILEGLISEDINNTVKNSTAKHEKIKKLKNDLLNLVFKDRYLGEQSPLFQSRIAEFRYQIFRSSPNLSPYIRNSLSSSVVEEQQLQFSNSFAEEIVLSEEQKLYRDYFQKKSANLLSSIITIV
jgi:hypothetical protein